MWTTSKIRSPWNLILQLFCMPPVVATCQWDYMRWDMNAVPLMELKNVERESFQPDWITVPQESEPVSCKISEGVRARFIRKHKKKSSRKKSSRATWQSHTWIQKRKEWADTEWIKPNSLFTSKESATPLLKALGSFHPLNILHKLGFILETPKKD